MSKKLKERPDAGMVYIAKTVASKGFSEAPPSAPLIRHDSQFSVPTRSEMVRFCCFTREKRRNGVLTKTCFLTYQTPKNLENIAFLRKHGVSERSESPIVVQKKQTFGMPPFRRFLGDVPRETPSERRLVYGN